MKYSVSLLLTLLLSLFLLGCGEEKELTLFKENMTAFYENVHTIGRSLDSVNPASKEAVALVDSSLSEMLKQLQLLASMDIPQQFASVDVLADDALEYMEEAVRLHSMAYGNDQVNISFVEAAAENYESAMKRIEYIATLLQGEIPEGATLIEGDDTEFEPYTE